MRRRNWLSAILTAVMLISMLTCFAMPASADTSGNLTYTVTDGKVTITDCSTSASSDLAIPSTLGGYPVTTIGHHAFSGCTKLTSVTIPDGVTTIGEYAFSGCTGLTSITIPDSVTSIVYRAFSGCTGLTAVTIPDSVTSIGDRTFYSCTGLTSVTIPDSVTTIGQEAFYGCTKLTSVTIPASVTSIVYRAFCGCTNLTAINVDSDNTTYCSVNGVLFNKGKTKLICYPAGKKGEYAIPDSVTTIGDSAFRACTGLTSVTIPDSVTTIGDSAFRACTGLTSVTIPDSVTTISERVFGYCTGLTSVTIPDSVTTIGESAFYDCTSLTSVVIPDSVTTIGSSAFYYCTGLTSVAIGNSVTTIGEAAFYDCTSLTSVVIPDSVTSIDRNAFTGCTSLTSITIPGGVKTIGYYVFYNCTGLFSIEVNAGNEFYCSKDGVLFNKDRSTLLRYPEGKKGTNYVMPVSVTNVEHGAFLNCTSLKDVYYADTKAEWNKISIGVHNEYLESATLHCLDDVADPVGTQEIYRAIATAYPTYLNEAATENWMGVNAEQCYSVIEDYSKTETGLLAFMESFVNGTKVLVGEVGSKLGLPQSTQEKWLEKNSLAFVQNMTATEPVLSEGWEAVKDSYKDFKFVYKASDVLSKAALINEIAKCSPLSYETIKDIVDSAYKQVDSYKSLGAVFDEADRVVDFADVTIYALQLYQVEKTAVERLLTMIPEDSTLYEGVSAILADMNLDPVSYVLTKYLSEQGVDLLASGITKLGKWATKQFTGINIGLTSALVTTTASFFYNYLYQGAKIDELYGAIVSYDFYITTQTALTDKHTEILCCKINGQTPSDQLLDDYEYAYNIRLVAMKQYMDSCINICKYDGMKKLLQNSRAMFDDEEQLLSFEKYIGRCQGALKRDIQSGTVTCSHPLAASSYKVNPTCIAQGYQVNTCEMCGTAYYNNYVSAWGHAYGAYQYNNDATCIHNGTETAYCGNSDCSASVIRTKSNSATGAHKWGTYTYNNNATCIHNGTEMAKCTTSGCSATNTRTKANTATGVHTWGTYTYNRDAACYKDGTETAKCITSGCSATNTRTKANTATGAHNWGTYISDRNATAGQDGTKTASCLNEGCTYTNSIVIEGSRALPSVIAVERKENEAQLNWSGYTVNRVYYGYAGEQEVTVDNWSDYRTAVGETHTSDFAPQENEVYILPHKGCYLFVIRYTDGNGNSMDHYITVMIENETDPNYGKPYLELSEDGKVAWMNLNGTTVQKMYWGFIGDTDYKYSTWDEFKTRIGDSYLPDYGVKDGEGYIVNQRGHYRFVIVYLDAQGIRQERYFTVKAETPATAPSIDNSALSTSGVLVNDEGYSAKVYYGYIGDTNTKYVDFNNFKATAQSFTTVFGPKPGTAFKMDKAGYWRFVINYNVNGATKDTVCTVYVDEADLALGTPKLTQSGNAVTLDANGATVSKLYIGYMGTEPVEIDSWADYTANRKTNGVYYAPKDGSAFTLGTAAGYYTVVVSYNTGGAEQLAFFTFHI